MRPRKKERWIGYQDPTHISLRPPAEWLAGCAAVGISPAGILGWLLGCPLPACDPGKAAKAVLWAAGGLTGSAWMEYTSPAVWVKA